MKVLLINGSMRKNGCTHTALSAVAEELKARNIDAEITWIGNRPVRGCIGCWKCKDREEGCIFTDDIVNRLLEKVREADGYIFGSPVYYASANGVMSTVMDRLFTAGSRYFAYKPGAVICSARRAGTTSTFDQLNKYLMMNKMIILPAPYWNMVHGNTPEEVLQDKEGIANMRSLGMSMAWMLELLKNGREQGIVCSDDIPKARTNFIR